MYQRPGSGANLHNIIQGDKESICNYVARWLKKKNMLTNIFDETAIEAFLNGARHILPSQAGQEERRRQTINHGSTNESHK